MTIGMESLAAVRFRAALSRQFSAQVLPNVGALLWDFPTLHHVVEYLSADQSSQAAPSSLSLADDVKYDSIVIIIRIMIMIMMMIVVVVAAAMVVMTMRLVKERAA